MIDFPHDVTDRTSVFRRRPRKLVAALALATAAGLSALAAAQTAPGGATTAPAAERVTPSGLKIIDLGRSELTVQPGDTVTCHYTGKLDNGTVFDSSLTRNQPFVFRLGIDGVIKGWAEGIVGMHVGDRRRLIIPPELGYGARGVPPKIPANATLTFDLEVLAIDRPKPLSDVAPPVAD